jgi:hypothetical protein
LISFFHANAAWKSKPEFFGWEGCQPGLELVQEAAKIVAHIF